MASAVFAIESLIVTQYRDPAGRHRSATFRRASDARDHRRQVENDLAGHRWRDPARGREPFGPYLERSLASAHELRPSTQALYGTIAAKHILPELRDVPIRALDAERVSGFLDGLVTRGVGIRTVQVATQVLSRVMTRLRSVPRSSSQGASRTCCSDL
jgi:hypothetical protein